MKEFNNEEKLAIAKILLDLIYIDGKVDRREISYFEYGECFIDKRF